MRDFLKALLERTQDPVYLSSLPNVKGNKPTERHVLSRELDVLLKFAKKWDVKGRGLFFCVSCIQSRKPRKKDYATQTCMVHLDVDFKAVTNTEKEVLKALSGLNLKPSRIHRSGNGLHAYWWLHPSPVADLPRVELAVKGMARVLGGDPTVTHSVALMRVPGSHNTKDGKWKEVEVIQASSRSYSLDQLEELARSLAAAPLVTRKGKDGQEANPFLDAADAYGFKPPIDAEKMLSEMTEGNIHDTQLSVSASLLAQGHSEDEVVAKILGATQKVGKTDWNWTQEEKTIRGMCRDFKKKHPQVEARTVRQEEPEPEDEDPAGSPAGSVVSLAEARSQRQPKPDKKKAHVVLGMGVLAAIRARGEDLVSTKEQLWRYKSGLWSSMQAGEGKAWLEAEIEVGCRALNVTSTQKLVSETRAWLMRNPEIFRDEVRWNEHGKIPTKSGLLDPATLLLEPLRPDHFATYRIECEYDPQAKCKHWLQMLKDCFADRPKDVARQYADLLQEILGVSLLEQKPRSLMRALVLVGPSDSGKSSILNTMSGLLSSEANATPFDALENAHGLVGFLRRAPWVLHEAFDQAKWHFSSTVKALLSGDPVNVNIKNGPMVTLQYRAPVFWGTNTPPQFKEATKAMVNRMIIVPCSRVFEAPTGAAEAAIEQGYASPAQLILDTERSGLLNWALEGMKRAVRNRQFTVTDETREILNQVRIDSNLVAGFMEECVDYDPDCMVAMTDFCAAFSMWWAENKGEGRSIPSNESIGRALNTLADPRHEALRGTAGRFRVGIRLRDVGLDYWESIMASSLAEGKTARLSANRGEVNRPKIVAAPEQRTQKRKRR